MRSKNFFLGGRFRTFSLNGASLGRPRLDFASSTELEPPAGRAAELDPGPARPRPQAHTLVDRLKQERAQPGHHVFRTGYHPLLLAKYDVKALVGRGTYSRVVRAENRLTRQPTAIKMIDVAARRGAARKTFDSELRILRRLRHPNIIQLIEVFESPEKLYLVLELATGGDLFDQIQARGVFGERDAARVLRMVLDGVCYLHGVGVTHRDLKPDNVLYYHPGADSKVLITDFGLAAARQKDEDIYMYTPCGTPEYIAPEMVTRRPYTCSVDLWAVGVMAYIMLSGSFPFENSNRLRLYKLIMRAKYSFDDKVWSGVSELAKRFIASLMNANAALRRTAEAALHDPWIAQLAYRSQHKAAFNTRSGTRAVASPPPGETASMCTRAAAVPPGAGRRQAPPPARRSGNSRVKAKELEKLQFDADVFLYQYELMRQRSQGACTGTSG